jgi:hypothetical protein
VKNISVIRIPVYCVLLAFALVFGFSRAMGAERAGGRETTKRVLYVFAHQDDEVMIAARIRADVAAGNEITFVWITRGDKAGDPVVREKESRAAMALLGAPESSLHFLGFEDSRSYATLKEDYAKTLEIARLARPDAIFSNAYEGGNIDHDIANFVAEMVSRVLVPRPPHYEFPLYNSYNGTYQVGKFIPRDGVETLSTPLDDKMVAMKIRMLDMYPSQSALFKIMGSLVDKKKLKKHGEPYRLVPEYDYLKPPTGGTLGYELGNNRIPHTFSEFHDAVLDFYNSPVSPVKPPAGE